MLQQANTTADQLAHRSVQRFGQAVTAANNRADVDCVVATSIARIGLLEKFPLSATGGICDAHHFFLSAADQRGSGPYLYRLAGAESWPAGTGYLTFLPGRFAL